MITMEYPQCIICFSIDHCITWHRIGSINESDFSWNNSYNYRSYDCLNDNSILCGVFYTTCTTRPCQIAVRYCHSAVIAIQCTTHRIIGWSNFFHHEYCSTNLKPRAFCAATVVYTEQFQLSEYRSLFILAFWRNIDLQTHFFFFQSKLSHGWNARWRVSSCFENTFQHI